LLKVLGTSCRGDVAWLDSDFKWDSSLDVRNEKVGPFRNCLLLDTAETVEDDGSCASWNIVEGSLQCGDTDDGRD